MTTHYKNKEDMEKAYLILDSKTKEICNRYGEPTIMSALKIFKNENDFSITLRSSGTSVKGSKREKAIDEIISLYRDGSFSKVN